MGNKCELTETERQKENDGNTDPIRTVYCFNQNPEGSERSQEYNLPAVEMEQDEERIPKRPQLLEKAAVFVKQLWFCCLQEEYVVSLVGF